MLYLPKIFEAYRELAVMAIRVLLADDATVMRRLIRESLEARPEIEVVGEAGDFAQTMRLASELKPDVVVMDLHMPSGIRAAPAEVRAHLKSCGSRLLAISIWNDEDSRALATDFGALVLLNKVDLGEALAPAILQLVSPDAEAK
jgi:DNA-binding NarL/FixJ family response regulator